MFLYLELVVWENRIPWEMTFLVNSDLWELSLHNAMSQVSKVTKTLQLSSLC